MHSSRGFGAPFFGSLSFDFCGKRKHVSNALTQPSIEPSKVYGPVCEHSALTESRSSRPGCRCRLTR